MNSARSPGPFSGPGPSKQIFVRWTALSRFHQIESNKSNTIATCLVVSCSVFLFEFATLCLFSPNWRSFVITICVFRHGSRESSRIQKSFVLQGSSLVLGSTSRALQEDRCVSTSQLDGPSSSRGSLFISRSPFSLEIARTTYT